MKKYRQAKAANQEGELQMNYYTVLADALRQLKIEKRDIKKQLKVLPKGHFECHKNGSGYKWFRIIDGKRMYISKALRSEAEGLAQRKFLELRLVDIEHEIKSINYYFRHHNCYTYKSDKLLHSDGYRELIAPMFEKNSSVAVAWANQDYAISTYKPEEKIYRSSAGIMHRSKGEALIATALFHHGIAFRYECEFRLSNGKRLFPDFMIYNPKNGDIFIWEHLGMMDIDHYRHGNMQKLVSYADNGYLVNQNLIVTMESDTLHIDMVQIEAIISRYFLS